MNNSPDDFSPLGTTLPDSVRTPILLALLGHPVGHSLSPLMHSTALKHLHLEGRYEAWDVSDLSQAMVDLKRKGFRGASVTIPYKRDIMSFLDDIDEQARSIGAVNTLIRRDDGFVGANTDWEGLIRALRSVTSIRGRRFVVLGAGGTARAALYGILGEGGGAVVVNRTEKRGRELADDFGCPSYPLTEIDALQGDVLINTTPVGMTPNTEVSPVPSEVLSRFSLVADVIYTPLRTRLLREAERAGCTILSGVEMFVEQGAAQFRLWTGLEPPVDLMRQVVRNQLEKAEKEQK